MNNLHQRQARPDFWNERNQVLEEMYVRLRARNLQDLLKERIKRQEASLENDRALLRVMERKYRRA